MDGSHMIRLIPCNCVFSEVILCYPSYSPLQGFQGIQPLTLCIKLVVTNSLFNAQYTACALSLLVFKRRQFDNIRCALCTTLLFPSKHIYRMLNYLYISQCRLVDDQRNEVTPRKHLIFLIYSHASLRTLYSRIQTDPMFTIIE